MATTVMLTNLGTGDQYIGYDAGIGTAVPSVDVRQLTTWSDLYAPGIPSASAMLSLPWIGAVYGLSTLGATPELIQRAIYTFLIWSALFSSYLLARTALHLLPYLSTGQSTLASLCAAVFYAFNPYTMLLLTYPSTTHELTWAVLPFGLVLLAKCSFGKEPMRHVVPLALAWLLIAAGNPALTLVSLALTLGLWLATVAVVGYPARRNAGAMLLAGTAFVLFSAYNWLPLVVTSANPYSSAVAITALSTSTVGAFNMNSAFTSLADLLHLTGSAAFRDVSYYHLVYGNALLVFCGYGLTFVSVLALVLTTGRQQFFVVMVSIFAVLGMFFAKGEHQPAGQFMTWAYGAISFFAVFRNSYDKFLLVVVLCFSLLLTFSSAQLLRRRNHICRIGIVLLITALSVGAEPFFAGKIASHDYLTHIPPDYAHLRALLRNDTSSAVVYAAPDFGGTSRLSWYNGNAPVDPILLGVPVVSQQWLRSQGISFDWREPSVYDQQFDDVLRLLPAVGVDYILIHKDMEQSIPIGQGRSVAIGGQTQAAEMIATLVKRTDLRLVLSSRYFELFKYRRGKVLPRAYATLRVSEGGDGIANLATLVKTSPGPTSGPGGPLTFVRQGPGTGGTPISNSNEVGLFGPPPQLQEMVELSSSAVRLERVVNSTGPFVLALLQTYDPNWEALVIDGPGAPTRAQMALSAMVGDANVLSRHVLVNGFGNGWFVNQKGSYWVVLIYRPEAFLWIGEGISASSLVGAIICMCAYSIVRSRRRWGKPGKSN